MPASYVHTKRRFTENLQAEIAADSWLPETEYIVQTLLLKAPVLESPWLSD